MYMTMRTMTAAPGRGLELLEASAALIASLNDKHGSNYSLSTQVGGPVDVIGAADAWETLGAYEAFRESVRGDTATMAAMQAAATMAVSAEDRIAKVLAAPGDRTSWTSLAEARMHGPRIAEAIPFGLEVAEFVEAKTGVKTGFLTAITGNQLDVAWVSRYESLDAMGQGGETLYSDPEYLELYKRADELFVDGSLVQTVWQAVG
jgi:hypothetical protein